MIGIILAGGKGSRLFPITKVLNKHLLPIYDKPMIYYSLSILLLAGIKKIIIVINPEDKFFFSKLLGDGNFLGIKIRYLYQKKPLGIPNALNICQKYVGKSNIMMILGDNIFYGSGLGLLLKDSIRVLKKDSKAVIYTYKVKDPSKFGVLKKFKNNFKIIEKPKKFISEDVVVGLYLYPNNVFLKINKLKKSKRKEYEISDLNNLYLREKKIIIKELGRGVAWFDTGSFDDLLSCSNFIQTVQNRQSLKISCIEELSLNNKWINKNNIKINYKKNENSYLNYLEKLIK
jgi:glucose-1-phosphate thymidylyltransferase